MAADWRPPIVPADASVVPVAAAAHLGAALAVGTVAVELFSREEEEEGVVNRAEYGIVHKFDSSKTAEWSWMWQVWAAHFSTSHQNNKYKQHLHEHQLLLHIAHRGVTRFRDVEGEED